MIFSFQIEIDIMNSNQTYNLVSKDREMVKVSNFER